MARKRCLPLTGPPHTAVGNRARGAPTAIEIGRKLPNLCDPSEPIPPMAARDAGCTPVPAYRPSTGSAPACTVRRGFSRRLACQGMVAVEPTWKGSAAMRSLRACATLWQNNAGDCCGSLEVAARRHCCAGRTGAHHTCRQSRARAHRPRQSTARDAAYCALERR